MDKQVKREVVATLVRQGRRDLASQFIRAGREDKKVFVTKDKSQANDLVAALKKSGARLNGKPRIRKVPVANTTFDKYFQDPTGAPPYAVHVEFFAWADVAEFMNSPEYARLKPSAWSLQNIQSLLQKGERLK